jgi:hypothetical protein
LCTDFYLPCVAVAVSRCWSKRGVPSSDLKSALSLLLPLPPSAIASYRPQSSGTSAQSDYSSDLPCPLSLLSTALPSCALPLIARHSQQQQHASSRLVFGGLTELRGHNNPLSDRSSASPHELVPNIFTLHEIILSRVESAVPHMLVCVAPAPHVEVTEPAEGSRAVIAFQTQTRVKRFWTAHEAVAARTAIAERLLDL